MDRAIQALLNSLFSLLSVAVYKWIGNHARPLKLTLWAKKRKMKLSILIAITFISLLSCGLGSKQSSSIVVETNTPVIGKDGLLVKSVGLETLGGVFTPIFVVGNKPPLRKTEVFSTAADNQDQIKIDLYRGGGKLVSDCQHLGEYEIIGIAKAPRGVPNIAVSFEIRDGSILLSARDQSDGRAMIIKKNQQQENAADRKPAR
jgi:molecular chaperone DnaK